MASLNYLYLKCLLKLHNYLYHKISRVAVKLNNGTHPKHQIMNFHQFFLDNIERDAKVLDIGCGIGALTYSISKKANNIVACDLNPNSINFARKNYGRYNIEYIIADATNYDFKQKFDYITLSNVLEHIKDRKRFLKKLKPLTNWFIIRVPMINRSWLTLYKKALGIEYRSDSTHYIEYTFNSFKKEIESVDLSIESYDIQFGEIWAKISC